MTRLRTTQACDLLDVTFDVGPDLISTNTVEVTVLNKTVMEAREEIDGYLASLSYDIDEHSIVLKPDHVDGTDMPRPTTTRPRTGRARWPAPLRTPRRTRIAAAICAPCGATSPRRSLPMR